jgi:hypothetical protein
MTKTPSEKSGGVLFWRMGEAPGCAPTLLIGEQRDDEIEQDRKTETEQHCGDECDTHPKGGHIQAACDPGAYAKQFAAISVEPKCLRHLSTFHDLTPQISVAAAAGTLLVANISAVAVIATRQAAQFEAMALKSGRFISIILSETGGQATGTLCTSVAENRRAVAVTATKVAAAYSAAWRKLVLVIDLSFMCQPDDPAAMPDTLQTSCQLQKTAKN